MHSVLNQVIIYPNVSFDGKTVSKNGRVHFGILRYGVSLACTVAVYNSRTVLTTDHELL